VPQPYTRLTLLLRRETAAIEQKLRGLSPRGAEKRFLVTSAFCGFMMQRGRRVILGDAGKNLGDSMYDGTTYGKRIVL